MAVFQWQEYPGLVRKTIEFDFRDNKYRGSLVAPPKSEGPKPLVLLTQKISDESLSLAQATHYMLVPLLET